MYILGINPGWHDSSAALLRNGELLILVEQDRVSRQKHAMMERPALAIEACLRHAGITLDDVEAVAIGWDEPVCIRQNGETYEPESYADSLLPKSLLPHRRRPPIAFIPHHLAHAESGLWASGFDTAALLVLDGRGETQATSMGFGGPQGIELFREWDIAQSLGNFYGHAADWAGFSFWGSGKLMGLASYGVPETASILDVNADGYRFGIDEEITDDVKQQANAQRRSIYRYFEELYPFARGNPTDIMAHAHFAATIQNALERAVFRLAEMVRDRTRSDRLVITGGVGLNCTFNGRLVRAGMFRDVYVPPVTFDTGVSLGAALAMQRQVDGRAPATGPMPHAYFGVSSTEEEIAGAIHASGLTPSRVPDESLLPTVARRISEGAVVGWFQGRAEIGQRALGTRSMLCDPRHRDRLVKVNKVKGREVWRPLAPSVLAEHYGRFFEGEPPRIADFMLAAMPVRREARRIIPATVHVDGSARPQVVRRETNPRYWGLIDEFRKITGVPAVMNTSFNLAGEPIVHTAADAISSFMRSEMDVLVIENYLFEKDAVQPRGEEEALVVSAVTA